MAKDGTNRGRPKGALGEKAKMLAEIVKELQDKGEIKTGEVLKALYTSALAGNVPASVELLNRMHGKATDFLDVTSDGGAISLTPEQREERERTLYAILKKKLEGKKENVN